MEAVIVEDEVNAKEALQQLLVQYCPQVEVISHARTLDEASEALLKYDPKVVFMDIQLGKEMVFSLFEKVDMHRSHVIFTTAYNEFAVEAFRLAAVDYLLKPINPSRLTEAVKKAESMEASLRSLEINALLANLRDNTSPRKIVLSTADMIHVVHLGDILHCQASQNYTTFNLRSAPPIIVSKTLKAFDELLTPQGFFRVHKSWLINLEYVKAYDKREGGKCIMADGSEIPVSPQRREQLLLLLQQLL
ncbi:MAG: LytTR family DNA-binding domain-containing protein [Bacteroidota bacterium]